MNRRDPLRILSRRNALLVLAALGEQHPQPMSMTAFTRASLLASERARMLREDMKTLDLLTVQPRGGPGPIDPLSIHLTPKGERVAARALSLRAALET